MISVIAYRPQDFNLLRAKLTCARVSQHFSGLRPAKVERFDAPSLHAFNFVLHGALRGGVTRSLSLDAHGKSLSSQLLTLEIEIDGPTEVRGREGCAR